MYRQGDVWLEPCANVKGVMVKPVKGRVIFARGEATGHDHSMAAEDAEMFRSDDGAEFVRVKRRASLVHQEHAAILLEPGVYRLRHQREYTPKAIHNVND